MKGSMLKRSTRKRDKGRSSPSKVLFQDPVGHALPPSLQSFRWNVDKVERKLQEKIQEKTKIAGNFVYQQAYRLLECTRGEGIDFVSFKEQLRIKFGIILEDSELQLLFDKYDEDRNGTIDLNEFIRRVLPPDYHYGRQWFELSQQESEERQAALKRESRNDFLMGMGIVRDDIDNTGETSNWTLETLMKQIQTKVVQKTPSGDDQYRRAFKMLRSGRDQGIRMRELRNNLKTKFGIFVSEKQMRELFAEFDMDGSGEIDLKEFLQFVEPPAYPGNSKVPRGLWTEEAGGGEGDEGEDEDNGEEGGETGGHADDSSTLGDDHHHNSRVPEDRPPSVRGHRQQEETAPRHGLSGPSTSTKNVIKKERPMSANPKKQAMLKQRREQMASTSQLLEKHLRDAEAQTQALGGGHHSVTKATQTRRLTMSMADIHSLDRPATADNKRVNFQHSQPAVEEDDGTSVRSGASSASTLRPRSASSVASSRTSAASLSSSVREGASYMRRPSTPQHLRQKCLESRLAGAVAQSTGKDSPQSKQPKKALAAADRGVVKRASASGPTQIQTRAREQRRHSYSDVDYEPERDSDHDEYEAPRVARVHPKQHDPRPYSQGGRVLLRSKVSSAGCR